MQITESIVAQISRKTFNQMFDPALRRSKVLMSGNGSSVNWADNAGHANSADSLTDLSQIESMLADYVSDTELETTLASYATKTWVDQNYLSLSFFNALFQARTSQGAVVAPNSGDTTTIDNIKAMFGFWTDQYISALGQGDDGGGPVTTLAQLNDVSLSLPLADGEVLTYSSALGKWTNGAGVSTSWANITGKPTTIAGYGITDAHITNGVITLGANSITPITSLTGYATESWVNTQLGSYVTTTALGTTLADYVTTTALGTTLADYATKTYVDQNYLSLAFFNALFQARTSGGVAVAPNSGDTTTIDNIKALFGFWTDQYLSALGLSAGGGGYTLNEPLSSINSAALGTPSQANVAIVWNGTAWTYGTTGGGSTAWADITGKPTTLAGYGITDAASTSDLASYLPLSGGTLQNSAANFLNINNSATSATALYVMFKLNGVDKAGFGYNNNRAYLANETTGARISVSDNGTPQYQSSFTGTAYTIYHSGNFTNVSQLNNDSGYITGITSSMVTTALGYTPISSSGRTTGNVALYQYTTSGQGQSSYDANNLPDGWNMFKCYPLNAGTSRNHGLLIQDSYCGTPFQLWLADSSNYIYKRYNTGSIGGEWFKIWAGYADSAGAVAWTNVSGRPTAVSSFTNDSGYITGITSSMVTTALGYTPANSTSLSNYLPLTAGPNNPLSGHLYIRCSGSAEVQFGGSSTINGSAVLSYYPTDSRIGIHFYGNDNILNILTSGNVGIGTVTPTFKLQVEGNQKVSATSSGNSAGSGCLYVVENGNIDFMRSLQVLAPNMGTRKHVCLCVGTADSKYNQAQIAFYNKGGSGSSNNLMALGFHSQDDILCLCCNGNVGIGLGIGGVPSYKLHVSGDIYATGGVTALSDIRHKTIVEDTHLQVSDIARMRAIRYIWNDCREDKDMHVGSIAQDWQQILPEVVLRANDAEGTLSLQYGVAALISSITIARKVVNHEQRITELEKECERLRFENEQLRLKIA